MMLSALQIWRAPLLTTLLFAALMGAGLVTAPPAVRGEVAPDAFNTQRALDRLERVLGDEAPHPTDSDGQDALMARLVAEIAVLGIAPDVRDEFACRAQPRLPVVDCARVRNIHFSIGPSDGPAILAAAHHDGIPAGPGAADDGIGLAVWLETAHILAQAPLQRRVIFLFSDGEEPGLLGADAFARRDPLVERIEAIVNLEARGTRGPAAFFETNTPNADAVRAYAAGARRPMANSIMADVYAMLPNDTDVTVLRRENVDIINIAVLDGVENYHTDRDVLANLDPRSVQHMGDHALGVTRLLASGADRGSAETLVFTDVASLGFIAFNSGVARSALAVGCLAAFVLFWMNGVAGWWRALLAPIFAVLLAGGVAFGIGAGLSALKGGEAYWTAYPEATRAWTALVALTSVVVALLLFARRLRAAQITDAAFFWFAALGVAGAWFMHGLSILFLPPVAIFVIAAIAARFWAPARSVGVMLAALTALVLWAPTLALTEIAMGYGFAFGSAALIALLLLTSMGPLAAVHGDRRWRGMALGAGACAAVAVLAAAVAPAYSAAKPRALNITYMLDADADEARFLAGSAARPLPKPLAAAAPFEPAPAIPGDALPSWSAPAPMTHISPARLTLLADDAVNGQRFVRARLDAHGAYRTLIRVPRAASPLRASIRGVEANLTATAPDGEWVGLACSGRACDGAEILLTLGAADADLGWQVIGQYPGANPIASDLIAARPDWAIPIQNGDATLTLTHAAFAQDQDAQASSR